MLDGDTPDVVVIGAGVIGLSTGLRLAERGLRVAIRTALLPPDTTSAVASAMVGPPMAPPDDERGRRERVSIAEFVALADVPDNGVRICRGRLAARGAGPPPPGPPPPPGTVQCADEDIPAGFVGAFWARVPLVDMPVYLRYLTWRFASAGGRIEQRSVTSLDDLAREVPLIANCAGLGARELAADESVRPVRGQHVIIDNPGLEEFFIEAPFTPEWAAFWPYPDHVVLGGTLDAENTSTEPDPDTAERILARCVEIEPRLEHARIRGHQVGLRPARPSPRLELERIGDALCVHNYGHGGSGVTLSWGYADAAAALLLDNSNVSPPKRQ